MESWQAYIADLLLFAPYGVGYAFTYNEVMEMDVDKIEFFYERKMKVLEALKG